MKHSIDRVEILRGTQSSLYGSGAQWLEQLIYLPKKEKGGGQKFDNFMMDPTTQKIFSFRFPEGGNGKSMIIIWV